MLQNNQEGNLQLPRRRNIYRAIQISVQSPIKSVKKPMTPASMAVSVSMTGHHIVEKQSLKSLGVWIVMVLLARECVLIMAIVMYRRGRVDLVQVILELRVAELDRRYRVEVVVLAHEHLRAV